MTTVKNNRPAPLTMQYVGGQHGRIDLYPGLNFNFPESELPPLRNHAVWAALLESGEIEILTTEPSSEGELEGFEVVEDKRTGQPLPMMETSVDKPIVQGNAQKAEPKPQVLVPDTQTISLSNVEDLEATKQALVDLPKIGATTAQRILDGMPYSTMDEVKAASRLNNDAWELVKDSISL